MSSKFLITRPRHEKTVSYLYHWSEEILKAIRTSSIRYSDFKGPKANRKEIEKYLKKQNPRLVMFNGHGDPNTITGHDNEPIIINGINEALLKKKIVYAVSCDAATKLGKHAITSGCETFIGYTGPFTIVHDAKKECTPTTDKFAQPFKETSNIIPLSLLNGKTPEEAETKFKQLTTKLIREYSTSAAEKVNKEIRFWLFWNSYFLKVHGNKTALF